MCNLVVLELPGGKPNFVVKFVGEGQEHFVDTANALNGSLGLGCLSIYLKGDHDACIEVRKVLSSDVGVGDCCCIIVDIVMERRGGFLHFLCHNERVGVLVGPWFQR